LRFLKKIVRITNKYIHYWSKTAVWSLADINGISEWSLWEANSCSSSKEIPHLSLSQKVYYCVCKSPPLVPILSQMNPVHTFPFYFSKIHSDIIDNLCLCLPGGLFPSGFLIKILYEFFVSHMHATCPIDLILLNLITVIICWKVQITKLLIMQCSETRC